MKLTGSEIVADMLAKEGVPYAIGIPGHGNLALVDAFRRYQDRIQIIMPRHEQAAVHMADGYYRVKGEPLAVFTSIGAGASNTAIGLATAYVDSIPLLLLIGETHTYMRGVGVLQEIERQYWSDMPRILYPTVKRAWHIDSAIQLQRAMGQAFNAMHTGRPGPALITLPMDVQADVVDLHEAPEPRARTWAPRWRSRRDRAGRGPAARGQAPRDCGGRRRLALGSWEELRALAEHWARVWSPPCRARAPFRGSRAVRLAYGCKRDDLRQLHDRPCGRVAGGGHALR